MIRLPWRRATSPEAPQTAVPTEPVPDGELRVLTASQVIEHTRTARLIDALNVKLGFPARLVETGVLPVVHAYAEFAQMLPASTAREPTTPGGLFVHGIEAAGIALDYRRGQILPKGAPPEVIGEQAHRWTYAVLIATLLHEVDEPLTALRVQMRRTATALEPWWPVMGALTTCCALSYRWGTAPDSASELRGKLPLLLFDRFVPTPIVEWLAADTALVRELLRHLSREAAGRGDALHDLAVRAHAQAAGRALASASLNGADGACHETPPSAAKTDARRQVPERRPARTEAPVPDEFLEPVEDPEMASPPRRKAR